MVLKERFADVDDQMEPNLGAEDFACYLERVPGVFIFLGCANPGRGITAINHSDRFDIDEPALGTGVKALLALTLDFLQTPELYAAR
jgi:metal-dependent amidase/aminoacylase/carboxypeptidase family protein